MFATLTGAAADGARGADAAFFPPATPERPVVETQRPDLFRAAICQVPLLDMVRYHKFLIARYWIAEYGDPIAPRTFAGSCATRRIRTCARA